MFHFSLSNIIELLLNKTAVAIARQQTLENYQKSKNGSLRQVFVPADTCKATREQS
jgi:hypothetical protein